MVNIMRTSGETNGVSALDGKNIKSLILMVVLKLCGSVSIFVGDIG